MAEKESDVYWMLLYQALGWVSFHGLLHSALTMWRDEYNWKFIDEKTEA